MEGRLTEGGIDRHKVFGYAPHNALEVQPLLLVILLEADEGALGGGAEDNGETFDTSDPLGHL